jgi:hypothetical protein
VEKLPLSSITIDDLEAMVEELQVSVRWARRETRDVANERDTRLQLHRSKPGFAPDTMARLWSAVGEPVIRHLGFEVNAQESMAVTRLVTQTMFSDARHLAIGHEYGGAALVLLLSCPSMQLEYRVPTLHICQITSSHHMYRPSAVS